MYRLIHISNDEYDKFVKTNKYGDICQLSSWADVKAPYWYSKRIAMSDENENIVATAQLLFRKIPKTNRTICYISRGFVCSYDDMNVVKAILDFSIEIAKKEKSIFITIDPIVERKDKPNLHKELEKLGFKHKGFTVGMVDFQPRFSMVTDISDDLDIVFKNFNSRAKTNIKKSTKYGLSFEISDISKIEEFSNLMEVTGKRDGFVARGKEYFERLLLELQKNDDAYLVLIKMYPKVTFEILKEEYNEILKELSKLNEKILKLEDDKKIENCKLQLKETENRKEKILKLILDIEPLVEKNAPILLSGSILTYCGEKAYYLYGASSDEYRELLSNYFMQWKMIEFSKKRGCTSYDFGGISGIIDEKDHEYGLFDFKRRFNSNINEKIGEFNYILDPIMFFIFNRVLKTFRTLRSRFSRRNS